MIAGIYQIINTNNNKRYIGSSVDLIQRQGQHLRSLEAGHHNNIALQRAYDKYGPNSLVFEILIYCHPKMCIWYEQQFLDQWKPEYNICPTAGSQLGRKCSDETIEKLRQSHLRVGAGIGYTHSEETKAKIGAAHKGLKHTEEMKENMRRLKTGFSWGHHSEESKRKISESQLGKQGRPGKPNIGPHTRWHLNRNITSNLCDYCRGGN